MSKATTCPQIVHNVQGYEIVQEKDFSINISEIFSPHDATLKFYLNNKKLPWLHIDENQGILLGKAPKVPYTKRFKSTITVVNEMGTINKSLILTVVDTEIVETMPATLEAILSLRKEDYGYSHLSSYTPSILEYLYHFYQTPEYQASFNKSVQDAAKALGIALPAKVTFHEFASVLKQVNPNIETILQQTLDQDRVLTETTLNNVLHAAADAVRKLQENNEQQQNLKSVLKPR